MGLNKSKAEKIISRKEALLKRIAKRMMRKRAIPEELEKFESLKKELGVKSVGWNNYHKRMELIE